MKTFLNSLQESAISTISTNSIISTKLQIPVNCGLPAYLTVCELSWGLSTEYCTIYHLLPEILPKVGGFVTVQLFYFTLMDHLLTVCVSVCPCVSVSAFLLSIHPNSVKVMPIHLSVRLKRMIFST